MVMLETVRDPIAVIPPPENENPAASLRSLIEDTLIFDIAVSF